MKLLLIGTGYMALEYAKVLIALNIDFDVIGRGESNCQKFRESYPTIKCISGGIEKNDLDRTYTHAIVASNIESLFDNAKILINSGIKKILLEKPGGKNSDEIAQLASIVSENKAIVIVAYNRRFYASTLKAKEIIAADGGVTSFNFEFTEWAHTIEPLKMDSEVKKNWFLANSTHVVDTAFFLGGKPQKLSAYHSGKNLLSWHPVSSNFAGSGISTEGAMFSYHANWKAPGRWVIEILTKKRRLIFKPMESLQGQMIGSVAVNLIELDDELDKAFKPGLYLQTKAFVDGDYSCFCSLEEQKNIVEKIYLKMSGYK